MASKNKAMVNSLTSRSLRECAQADWYNNYEDPRSPLGSLLESIEISEPCSEKGQQPLTIRIRLLASDRSGRIELTYSGVRSYSLQAFGGGRGTEVHGVLIKEELHLTKHDWVKHNVKLVGGEWKIEADDALYQWKAI
ncbi:MAG TPA: hypothetical protein VJ756_13235 [Terriglobales bacterium]|nr:hypothetical protein [Terriglobales bacterium]